MENKALLKNDQKGYLSVYTAKISSIDLTTPIISKERIKYLDGFNNSEAKKQSLAVWILLERVIATQFAVDLSKIKFYREKSGKWGCDLCQFSLSHTDGVLAVAISDKTVGIDIEVIRKIKSNAFKDRFLTEEEKLELETAQDKDGYLIKAWTKKESVFKAKNGDFKLTDKEYDKTPTSSVSLEIDGKRYELAVAGERVNLLKIITEQE